MSSDFICCFLSCWQTVKIVEQQWCNEAEKMGFFFTDQVAAIVIRLMNNESLLLGGTCVMRGNFLRKKEIIHLHPDEAEEEEKGGETSSQKIA